MYFEVRHVDAMNFIAEAYRDDIAIEGGRLQEECASPYYPPDAWQSEEEQANL